jgi:stage II sporulation protein E
MWRKVAHAGRLDLPLTAECAVRCALAFALSGAHILGGLSPFAIGFVASAGGAVTIIASFVGAAAGYLAFGSVVWAVKYIAVAIIISTVAVVFRDTEVFRSAWFMPLCLWFVTLCIGLVTAASGGWSFGAATLMVTDSVVAGGCAYFYRLALSTWAGRLKFEQSTEVTHTISVLITIATLLIALAGLKLFGVVSIGRSAAVLVVLLAAYKGGSGFGSACGVAVGLAMDAALGDGPFFSAAYAAAGLVSGIFARRGKLAFTLSFILASASASVMAMRSPAMPPTLFEVFVASVIFMLIPASAMSRVGALLPENARGNGVQKAREYTKSHVDGASRAFRDLYESVNAATETIEGEESISCVFDRAADAVCRKCKRSAECWTAGYQSTRDVMNHVTPVLQERGMVEVADFPDYFADECDRLQSFAGAVNSEHRLFLQRKQLKNRLRAGQVAAFSQYSDLSEVLTEIGTELGGAVSFEPELENRLKKYFLSNSLEPDVAVFRDRGGRLRAEVSGVNVGALRREPAYLDKLSAVLDTRLYAAEDMAMPDRLLLLEAEPLAATVGIAYLKKRGQDVSGDKGAYFKTEDGVLHVILSDGMGSGESAARCSADAVRILERFLRSGIAPETAVRMLNNMLLLRNEGDTVCATIDLICVNLFSGEVRTLKYGASPTYIKCGANLRLVRGTSMAAGLCVSPDDAPDKTETTLRAGSVALIVSDGVTQSGDEWLMEKLQAYSGGAPCDFAREIVGEAAKLSGFCDDTTAIVIELNERE